MSRCGDPSCPYLDAAVKHLRGLPAHEREHDVLDEDVARISPLKHVNLNCLDEDDGDSV
ncbi:transposase [Streptomyces asoensis]|uniref:Transposase n=1 Tax=Streptomyces asoensis TaxID=249586 RepID=A0A6M4X2D2_9ACTN|nr:hypothetical protein [Streptomyces asoensis]QJT06439.1 transposase [Streptomyces asoensis]